MTSREHWEAWVQRQADLGMCQECGKRPPRDGGVKCAPCMERSAGRNRARHAARRARGECARCGERPRLENSGYCAVCTKRHSKDSRNYRKTLKRRGLCERCRVPLGEDARGLCCGPCADRNARRKTPNASYRVTRWTGWQLAQLRAAFEAGKTYVEMGAIVGKTKYAVSGQIARMGFRRKLTRMTGVCAPRAPLMDIGRIEDYATRRIA